MTLLTAATTDPSRYLFWITSRAAGTAALVLASATVGFGLVMGGRLIKGAAADRRIVHEVLSLSVMVAIAVHALALVADSYLHPSVLDVTVPFVFSYKTLATSVGIIGGWGMIFLGLSYYIRARIGTKRWRLIHRFTALMWVLGLIHAFTEGTDAGTVWFVALIGLTASPAMVLLVARLVRSGRAPHAPRTRPALRGTDPSVRERSPSIQYLGGSSR